MLTLLLPLLFPAVTTLAASLSLRADGDTFSLFAYGPSDSGIGGFPIVYINGSAYIGDESHLGIPIFFVDDSSTWIAQPNSTSSNATFDSATFFVPGPASSSRQVGFANSTDARIGDAVTSGWGFYGHVALNEAPDGVWNSLFYAVKTSTTGLWSLNWNVTSDSSAISVTIKDNKPPNVAVKGRLV